MQELFMMYITQTKILIYYEIHKLQTNL